MTSFERVPVPPDALYLTPGDEVTATMQPTPGGDAVAIGFTDPRAGTVRILLHPEAARAVADGIGQVLAHAPYLRAENAKISNNREDTN
jgi:hypothetical protein